MPRLTRSAILRGWSCHPHFSEEMDAQSPGLQNPIKPGLDPSAGAPQRSALPPPARSGQERTCRLMMAHRLYLVCACSVWLVNVFFFFFLKKIQISCQHLKNREITHKNLDFRLLWKKQEWQQREAHGNTPHCLPGRRQSLGSSKDRWDSEIFHLLIKI